MSRKKHSSKKNFSSKDKGSRRDKHYSKNQSSDKSKIIPPCSKYLGNDVPFLKDCRFIYINENRIFTFLSTTPLNKASIKTTLNTNVQISLKNFIIGYYISQVQKNLAYYDCDVEIHSDKKLNKLIHELLNTNSKSKLPFATFIDLVVSNGDAIRPFISFSSDITSLNYTIIFILHIIECNPALYYGNNSYITNNIINQILASQNISLPINKLKL